MKDLTSESGSIWQATKEISIGDYVLTGGELPAMIFLIDSISRLVPGVLGNETSAVTDSFSTGLLEYPNHARGGRISAVSKCLRCCCPGIMPRLKNGGVSSHCFGLGEERPDLLEKVPLTEEDRRF